MPPPPPGRRGRSLASAFGIVVSQGTIACSMIVGVRLLTEMLPPGVFGTVSLLIGAQTLGRSLFYMPISHAAFRYYPEAVSRGTQAPFRAMLYGDLRRASLILSTLVLVVGLPFCWGQPRLLVCLPVLVGLLWVDNVRGIEIDLLNAARRQGPFALVRAVEAWLKPLGAVLVVLALGPAPAAVLLGYLVAGLAAYACLFLTRERRAADAAAHPDPAEVASIHASVRRFVAPLIPIAVLDWVSNLSDRYLIGGLLGLDAAGTYVAAYGLMTQPFAVTQGTIELVMRPHYFEAVVKGDGRRSRRLFLAWLGAVALACALGTLAITLLQDVIAAVCLAERYRGAAHLFPFLAAGSAMLAVTTTCEKMFHASQRTVWCLIIRATGAFLSVAVAAPMIWLFGVPGAAWAVPLYFGAQMVLCLGLAARTFAEDGALQQRPRAPA